MILRFSWAPRFAQLIALVSSVATESSLAAVGQTSAVGQPVARLIRGPIHHL